MEMVCSDPACGKEILGSVCVVGDADPEPEEVMAWGDLLIYPSTKGGFALMHPNCFTKFQNELLRQERSATILLALGKVEDVREALMIG